MVSFAVEKFLSLIRSHLFIFLFIFITLGDGSRNILLWFMSQSVLHMFSSKGFIVLGITFMSLIPFDFIFVYSVRQCFDFTVLHVNCPVYPEPLTEKTIFSIVYSCLYCCRLFDHRCMTLFLGFLCCSIDLCICFCANTILFWWLQFYSIVWSQRALFLQLSFSFSRKLWLFEISTTVAMTPGPWEPCEIIPVCVLSHTGST